MWLFFDYIGWIICILWGAYCILVIFVGLKYLLVDLPVKKVLEELKRRERKGR